MEKQTYILVTIIFMMLVTAIPRILPIAVFSKYKYPKALTTWLKFVPGAVLAAILAPEILLSQQKFDLSFHNLYFWVAIPTFLIGIRTRNLLFTIVFGMGALALIRLFSN